MTSTDTDRLVIFGITGDLARVATLRSLYRLERRGLLWCPIVGVAADDWSVDKLRQYARDCVEATGERLDPRVFARFADRLSYLPGEVADPELYQRLAAALRGARVPVHYLETPPSTFATVAGQLAEAGLIRGGRVVVERPFGHDLASARTLAADLHRHVPEPRLYRVDHVMGKLGLEEILYLRFANTLPEPVWHRNHVDCVQITLAESAGVEDRGQFYDSVGALRDVVVHHAMHVLAAGAMEPPAGLAPDLLKDGELALWRAVRDADPAHCVRGQYDGYRDTAGVAPDSTTETYAALRLEIDNWRWSGVPFFIRTGKHLPATATELRLIFKRPPRLGLQFPHDRTAEPDELVVKLDPTTGSRIDLEARHADAPGPERVTMAMEFAQPGGDGASLYEVLLLAAMRGVNTRFIRQDGVEETWRILQPLLDSPPPVHPYLQGGWGPAQADALAAGYGGWRRPWTSS